MTMRAASRDTTVTPAERCRWGRRVTNTGKMCVYCQDKPKSKLEIDIDKSREAILVEAFMKLINQKSGKTSIVSNVSIDLKLYVL